MNNKQVLVFILLESTNDLRSIFVGHIHFKKLTTGSELAKKYSFAKNFKPSEK